MYFCVEAMLACFDMFDRYLVEAAMLACFTTNCVQAMFGHVSLAHMQEAMLACFALAQRGKRLCACLIKTV